MLSLSVMLSLNAMLSLSVMLSLNAMLSLSVMLSLNAMLSLSVMLSLNAMLSLSVMLSLNAMLSLSVMLSLNAMLSLSVMLSLNAMLSLSVMLSLNAMLSLSVMLSLNAMLSLSVMLSLNAMLSLSVMLSLNAMLSLSVMLSLNAMLSLSVMLSLNAMLSLSVMLSLNAMLSLSVMLSLNAMLSLSVMLSLNAMLSLSVMLSLNAMLLTWIYGYLRRADADKDNTMSFKEVKSLLRMINIEVTELYARQLFKQCDRSGNDRLENSEIEEFCRRLTRRPELEALFCRCSGEDCVLSDEELLEFLREQGEEATLSQAREIIQEYELNDTAKQQRLMMLDGFLMYLLSKEGDVFNPAHATVYQDMSQPLSHYFISSSHNTYLLQDQLGGPSSTEAYLSRGCRCVELDCWEGPNGEPIVEERRGERREGRGERGGERREERREGR
ncbi:UNVERIFIED_CONTAM: hypothetical protein FKN15_005356 [Acipenser sinensis]